jgi:Domain of unknown function (DUF1793)
MCSTMMRGTSRRATKNQLTTDDFAGHVTHNANLALKAIDALEAYADLASLLGKNDVARDFSKTAHEYALKWIDLDKEGDHYKIAYDSANTWSQKSSNYTLSTSQSRERRRTFFQSPRPRCRHVRRKPQQSSRLEEYRSSALK